MFLEEHSHWVVDREAGTFSPILSLKVFKSEIWVSTYGADFFPVTAKPSSNSILLEGVRFLRPSPVKIENGAAELVKPYAAEDVVFRIRLLPSDCKILDKLSIDIINLVAGNTETLNFGKFKSLCECNFFYVESRTCYNQKEQNLEKPRREETED